MTDPTTYQLDPVPTAGETFGNALSAAEGAIQAAMGIWARMTEEERQSWFLRASGEWPRRDLWLPIILQAGGEIIEAEIDTRYLGPSCSDVAPDGSDGYSMCDGRIATPPDGWVPVPGVPGAYHRGDELARAQANADA